MKTLAFFLLLSMSCYSGFAQVYRITFTGKGDAGQIDRIKATNLNSNESMTIWGFETLYLEVVQENLMGVASARPGDTGGQIYPNPFQGNATLLVSVTKPQLVSVAVRNLSGQVVSQTANYVEAGGNEFSISVPKAGLYFITATTDEGTSAYKAVCTDPAVMHKAVTFKGASAPIGQDVSGAALKAGGIPKTLVIKKGDVILYQCMSGDMITLMAESPDDSKNLEVEFAKCTDAGGKNYPVITIGNQTWMAGNLAWLPGVGPSSEGSIASPKYYVYGFGGYDIRKAKESENYQTYGVLYNWEAARTACPEGWRLPTDGDWVTMENYLGMKSGEAGKCGWRHSGEVGCQLKEPGKAHWNQAIPVSEKLSGFFALPAGYAPAKPENITGTKSALETDDTYRIGFARMGLCTFFWSSSEYDSQSAWNRRLGCMENGVERQAVIKSYGYSVRCIRGVPEGSGETGIQ